MVMPTPPVEPTKLALETQAYQALVEGHRADPDDEHIYEDMMKAKAAMEIEWLASTARKKAIA